MLSILARKKELTCKIVLGLYSIFLPMGGESSGVRGPKLVMPLVLAVVAGVLSRFFILHWAFGIPSVPIVVGKTKVTESSCWGEI